MTVLRQATPADLEVVASWITSARECELWAGQRLRFPIDLEQLPRTIELSKTNAFSLVDDVRVVGFGQLLAKDRGRGHLARIIVSPSARGRGLGARIVESLLDRARADSYHQVSLYVDRGNLRATTLYARFGFREAPSPDDRPRSASSMYMVRAL
jgi:[ribosomal protein S18]-alanine N-acetyltransferase